MFNGFKTFLSAPIRSLGMEKHWGTVKTTLKRENPGSAAEP